MTGIPETTAEGVPMQCGNCRRFRPPLGSDERKFCGAELGLMLGPRTPASDCQSQGSFIATEQALAEARAGAQSGDIFVADRSSEEAGAST